MIKLARGLPKYIMKTYPVLN